MASSKYPPELHEYVKAHCKDLKDVDLAEECNKRFGTDFDAGKMKAFRGNHGYIGGRKTYSREDYWKRQKRWPQGMYEYIRDNSWGVTSEEMAKRVNEKFGTNFTKGSMKQFRQRNGIKSGLKGWFQKEHPSWCKGITVEEICKGDPEKIAKVKGTYFKKGERPTNERPVGNISIVNGYKLRKKSMEGSYWDRWEFLHRAVWEEANGPIPEGHIVSFKDGNPMNCELDNLMLITRRESQQLTARRLRSGNPELTEAAVAMIRLNDAVRDKKKGKT